jgi:hypothetical protein
MLQNVVHVGYFDLKFIAEKEFSRRKRRLLVKAEFEYSTKSSENIAKFERS